MSTYVGVFAVAFALDKGKADARIVRCIQKGEAVFMKRHSVKKNAMAAPGIPV